MYVAPAWKCVLLDQPQIDILSLAGFGSVAPILTEPNKGDFAVLVRKILVSRLSKAKEMDPALLPEGRLNQLRQAVSHLDEHMDDFVMALNRVGDSASRVLKLETDAATFWATPQAATHSLERRHAINQAQQGRDDLALQGALQSWKPGKPMLIKPIIGGLPADAQLRKETRYSEKVVNTLRHILTRAGPAARVSAQIAAVGTAGDALLRSVLGHGAARTGMRHTNNWRRLEEWFRTQEHAGHPFIVNYPAAWTLYPPSPSLVLAFVENLVHAKNCGPCVPGAVLETVKWMCRKLGMQLPDLDMSIFKALQGEARTRCTRTVKKAIPFPTTVVQMLEAAALGKGTANEAVRLTAGWTCCLIYASLRFDDALHVRPATLRLAGGALRGCCWQTKRDRIRKGTHFAVPDVSIGEDKWLGPWWDWARPLLKPGADFWMPKCSVTGVLDKNKPAEFKSNLFFMRHTVFMLIQQMEDSEDKTALLASRFNQVVTWHSCRCTVPSWAGEAGKDALSITLQMHSVDTRMAAEYQRQTLGIPIQMVTDLCQAMASGARLPSKRIKQWQEPEAEVVIPLATAACAEPQHIDDEDGQSESSESIDSDEHDIVLFNESEDEDPEDPTLAFFIKCGDDEELEEVMGKRKYHIPSELEPGRLACCTDLWSEGYRTLGGRPPHAGQVCKRCLAVRTSVAARVAGWGH